MSCSSSILSFTQVKGSFNNSSLTAAPVPDVLCKKDIAWQSGDKEEEG